MLGAQCTYTHRNTHEKDEQTNEECVWSSWKASSITSSQLCRTSSRKQSLKGTKTHPCSVIFLPEFSSASSVTNMTSDCWCSCEPHAKKWCFPKTYFCSHVCEKHGLAWLSLELDLLLKPIKCESEEQMKRLGEVRKVCAKTWVQCTARKGLYVCVYMCTHNKLCVCGGSGGCAWSTY